MNYVPSSSHPPSLKPNLDAITAYPTSTYSLPNPHYLYKKPQHGNTGGQAGRQGKKDQKKGDIRSCRIRVTTVYTPALPTIHTDAIKGQKLVSVTPTDFFALEDKETRCCSKREY